MKNFVRLAGTVLFLGSTSASAATPPALLNKSVVVSATIHTPAIGTDGSKSASRNVQLTFYVSSLGRVFTRADHVSNYDSRMKERSQQAPGTKLVQFSGNAIVAHIPLLSGAAQLRVNFDAAYRSCSSDIIIGNVGNKPVSYIGFNGVKYTTTGKPNITNVSCSIRDGNALSN